MNRHELFQEFERKLENGELLSCSLTDLKRYLEALLVFEGSKVSKYPERAAQIQTLNNLISVKTLNEVDPMKSDDSSQDGQYVDRSRINELKNVTTTQFDLSRLIKILEELNTCRRNHCDIAVITLTRALLDHVPPIFSCKKFLEVTNNYACSKSFKESMKHLENSSRKIADQHLHTQIRQKESLPNSTQVNFSNDIDVLLGEIVRVLK